MHAGPENVKIRLQQYEGCGTADCALLVRLDNRRDFGMHSAHFLEWLIINLRGSECSSAQYHAWSHEKSSLVKCSEKQVFRSAVKHVQKATTHAAVSTKIPLLTAPAFWGTQHLVCLTRKTANRYINAITRDDSKKNTQGGALPGMCQRRHPQVHRASLNRNGSLPPRDSLKNASGRGRGRPQAHAQTQLACRPGTGAAAKRCGGGVSNSGRRPACRDRPGAR